MTRRHLGGAFGGVLAVLALGTLVAAASLDLHKAREQTKELTQKNATSLLEVSSAVPDELHLEVMEIVQSLTLSRDRILLFLDRIENGLFPAEDGAERSVAIAKAAAQKEEKFLRALKERVPAAVVPKIDNAMMVSTESWEGVRSAFQLSEEQENRDLPARRPGFDLTLPPGLPGSFPSQ
ncbi:MAG: hypothetical protein ACE5IQ_10445 [Candidatus Methylomirabilales bacterium]